MQLWTLTAFLSGPNQRKKPRILEFGLQEKVYIMESLKDAGV
jgi:hypothetical protein